MQNAIHEGYEYQDYFSVSIILQLMLQRKDAEIIVDRKDFNGDKFDDLKVKLSNRITDFAIYVLWNFSKLKYTKLFIIFVLTISTRLCRLVLITHS